MLQRIITLTVNLYRILFNKFNIKSECYLDQNCGLKLLKHSVKALAKIIIKVVKQSFILYVKPASVAYLKTNLRGRAFCEVEDFFTEQVVETEDFSRFDL